MVWYKKAQGLDLNEDVDNVGADQITPEVAYEQLVSADQELREIVEWLTKMNEAVKHVPPARQRLEQILQQNGINGIADVPELAALFTS